MRAGHDTARPGTNTHTPASAEAGHSKGLKARDLGSGRFTEREAWGRGGGGGGGGGVVKE